MSVWCSCRGRFWMEDVPSSSRVPLLAGLGCAESAVTWSQLCLALGLWTLGHSAAVVLRAWDCQRGKAGDAHICGWQGLQCWGQSRDA